MTAKITFIQPDGASQTVEAEPGVTVMEGAPGEPAQLSDQGHA
jgi:hypothetical protein